VLSVPRLTTLRLKIGDIGVVVTTGDPDLQIRLEGPAKAFAFAERECDATVRVSLGDLAEPTRQPRLFDSGALWRAHRDGAGFLFQFTSPRFGAVPYKVARFTPRFATGEVVLHRPYFADAGPLYPLEYPLDELLLIHLLADGRGVELHGCGVVDGPGAGYLFVGQSGAGKTTIARLWQRERGATILSDDRVVLRKINGRFRMYGTPWHGDEPLACPAGAELTTVFFLSQAEKLGAVPLRRIDAVARLLACSFPPFYSAPAMEFTVDLLEALTCLVPCVELRFTRTGAVVPFIRGEASPHPVCRAL
jgi:hypothetical protein